MTKETHIILGETSVNSRKIGLLRKNGKRTIYVVDDKQVSNVREENGVTYVSSERAMNLLLEDSGIIRHYYVCRPPGQLSKKKQRV